MATNVLQFTNLTELRQAVDEAVRGADRGEAYKLSGYIRHELQQQSSMLVTEPNGALQLAEMLVNLSYIRFVGLSDGQALALIKDHLPAAFSLPDFSFSAALTERLDLYERIEDKIVFEQQLLNVLQKHTAVLGDATISVGNRQLAATIANWLVDYDNFPSKAQRDELDVLNYLNKSANVRTLSESERKILLVILEIYDEIKQDIYDWNSVPEPQSEAEAFKDFDLYAELPDVDYDPADRASVKDDAAFSPVSQSAPAPTPNKIVAPAVTHGFAPAPVAPSIPVEVKEPELPTTPPVTTPEPAPVQATAPEPTPHRVINRPNIPVSASSDAATTQKEVLANIQAAKAQGLVSAKLPPVAPLPHPDVVPSKLDDLRKRIQP